MRAASQPSPKNSGRASSHQNSISISSDGLTCSSVAVALGTRQVTAQARDLATLAQQRCERRGHPEHRPGRERGEDHEHQRQTPLAAEEEMQIDELVVLDRETEQEEEQDRKSTRLNS